jgi:DNA-directed RNA polymerase sigma subunit (sigma70/sigma32)
MVGRKKTAPAVASEAGVQAVLRRGAARELSPEEEKVMRMRLGASPPRDLALERVGRGLADVEVELLAFEIEAFLKLRERRERAGRTRAAAPQPSRAKERIIRALRRKGR